jgi:arylsulfatase A-like enzyme
MSGSRIRLWALLGAAALLGLGAVAWRMLQPAPVYSNANVVFIVLDTTRADRLGTYGYKRRQTSPHIDDFAERSTVFEMAFSHSPWTKPSVASMFTSLTPREHGIFDWKIKLDEALLTLPEHLQAQGFVTQAHISHHAFQPKDTNFKLGFDHYDKSVLTKGSPHEVTSSAEITDHGIKFLKHRPDKRFFLWLHYTDPHEDYIRHEQFDFGKSKKARYDSEIAFMDHHLGRLFEELEEGDHLQDTIVVIVADHGEGLGDHRINKHTKALYEQQIHVPLIIYVPTMAPGRVSQTVPLIDIAPTLTDLLGLPTPEQFQGQTMVAEGSFAPADDRVVFSETRRFADLRSVIKGGWKLIEDQLTGQSLLYNIADDPEERVNLVDEQGPQLAELRALLDGYKAAPHKQAESQPLAPDMQEALEALGYME